MHISILPQAGHGETRVPLSPGALIKLKRLFKTLTVSVPSGAGDLAGFTDADYQAAGADITTAGETVAADIVVSVAAPSAAQAAALKPGSLLVGNLDPAGSADLFADLAARGVHALAMEKIPRISRAQAMDTLSSQANIAGYRAVLEATQHYGRFLPLMMTAAGSAKPAKVIVLGVGVAGLQAIATAKRLGASVEAFDVRPETAEQVHSLGAKFITLDIGEEGSGTGGYAKELSEEGKQKQQAALQAYLAKADIVITTAQIPGRPAPVLVTAEAVQSMKPGSVVVDMAAGGYNQSHGIAGGNCPLTKPDAVTIENGVILVGHTNYPAMLPSDASHFFGMNVVNLLGLLLAKQDDGTTALNLNLADEIIAGSLVVHEGVVR